MIQTGILDVHQAHWGTHLLILSLGVVSSASILLLLYGISGGVQDGVPTNISKRLLILLIAIISPFLTMPIHEGLHGLALRAFGNPVHFGFKPLTRVGPVFWTSSPSLLVRNKMVIVALAPQILTLLALFGYLFVRTHLAPLSVLLVLIISGNFGGGCGDFWTITRLVKYPKNASFIDNGVNMTVWAKGR